MASTNESSSMSSKIASVAIATISDAKDVNSWSGIPAHIGLAFEGAGIRVFQGSAPCVKEPSYYRWLRSAYWRFGRGWFLADVEPRILKQRANALQCAVEENSADAVVSILPDPITAAPQSVPTALVHDGTFAQLVDYYPHFSRLSRRSLRLGHEGYRRALEHASVAIFSSGWAARSAIQDYGADSAKVHVIEFGANLCDPPSRERVASFAESRRTSGVHRFLFLGIEWNRKGGDDAVAFVKTLRRMGLAAYLDIVGCTMQGNAEAREFCIEHGFLDKRKAEDRNKLDTLLQNASFLLVPSIAECFGCVYCEANAYGVPNIGRDTGGVSQVIRPGVNGFLLSAREQAVTELAEQVRPVLLDSEKYLQLSSASRTEFEQRLNWNRFVAKTQQLLEEATHKLRWRCPV